MMECLKHRLAAQCTDPHYSAQKCPYSSNKTSNLSSINPITIGDMLPLIRKFAPSLITIPTASLRDPVATIFEIVDPEAAPLYIPWMKIKGGPERCSPLIVVFIPLFILNYGKNIKWYLG